MSQQSQDIIEAYYAAFNAGDDARFLDLLTDDVMHDINQGTRQIGKPAFADFIKEMSRCYREQITDLVILTEPSGARAAAEFTVHGEYLEAGAAMPPAHGQRYVLPAGAFFVLRGGKVARISNYYNLPSWLAQVAAS